MHTYAVLYICFIYSSHSTSYASSVHNDNTFLLLHASWLHFTGPVGQGMVSSHPDEQLVAAGSSCHFRHLVGELTEQKMNGPSW